MISKRLYSIRDDYREFNEKGTLEEQTTSLCML